MESRYIKSGDVLDYTPGSALTAGDVLQLEDGRAAVAVRDIAAGTAGSVRTRGVNAFLSASGTTFSKGDQAWWDSSANLAIATPGEAADFFLGSCEVAKVSGETEVFVRMNECPEFKNGVIHSRVIEVDTETGVQAAAQNIVPAAWNKLGLILLAAYGLVTEVFGGASQDQGIVTIEDSDGTDLCTLTPSDGGADAAGDVIVGTAKILGATTGDAVKTVAAGKGVQALVSQATSGAGAAGKMKVFALFASLV